jgi:hypothetical protein
MFKHQLNWHEFRVKGYEADDENEVCYKTRLRLTDQYFSFTRMYEVIILGDLFFI